MLAIFILALTATVCIGYLIVTRTDTATEIERELTADRKRRVLHVHAGDEAYQQYTRMR